MSPPNPDRTLRRLITELANLHADDLTRILDALSKSERKAVQILLCEYLAASKAAAITAVEPLPFDRARFSPWLVRRLEELEKPGAQLTSRTRETLRACATRLYPKVTGNKDIKAKSGRRFYGRRRRGSPTPRAA